MSTIGISGYSLPTLDKLGVRIPQDLNPQIVASDWFRNFSKALHLGNAQAVAELCLEDVFWRDMLALTWDFRTIHGKENLEKLLSSAFFSHEFSKITIDNSRTTLQRDYPDTAWVQAFFSFETKIGICSGIFRLVPTASLDSETDSLTWKGFTIYTNLEDLVGHPESIGPNRDYVPNHGKWREKRRREINFEDSEPAVIIIGAGQSGLGVAARLKQLGVPTLVIEKRERIGDQWRERYEALCLHDPVWADHLPYIPFPTSWPVWTPAIKLADWLESYAHSMELNVWTSSYVEKVIQGGPGSPRFAITVCCLDGTKRTFKVNHLVLAIIGFGGGEPNIPEFPGMDSYEGKVIHSSQHKSARENIGKKVVVVGACTSGHDIAQDHVEHGVDVTLYQRGTTYIMSTEHGMPRVLPLYIEGGPPTDVSDRISASFPFPVAKEIFKRVTKEIAELDKELLDGLTKRGFQLEWGEEGSGLVIIAYSRGGGYYLDVGACQSIIDGKIKLKSGSQIKEFTKTGIKFDDGSELPADVVILATGYGDARIPARKICGDEIADKLTPVWGFTPEGEIRSAWRFSGVEGVYFMTGSLNLCRFHSKHIALQIKAEEVGIPIKRLEF